uniref:Transcription factor bHLH167-like isoform X1 n=1 Tax=Cymbidium sinense TaxID=112615 RepID=A0A513X4W2_9ASPA|nr:transcription factor bHLH167-like isoform X1 [Cymbidium sinense]
MKGGDAKMDRKTVEKNRRMQMKNLCFKLATLIPKEFISKDATSQQDHLDRAAAYIQKLRERIERLKQRKESGRSSNLESDTEIEDSANSDFKLPVVEVRHQEQNLEVLLISGLKKRFALNEVIGILEEEGADVVNASFSVVGNKIIHTIHCQAISSRIGLEASRASERLQELIR